jgi:hypothetical protein
VAIGCVEKKWLTDWPHGDCLPFAFKRCIRFFGIRSESIGPPDQLPDACYA